MDSERTGTAKFFRENWPMLITIIGAIFTLGSIWANFNYQQTYIESIDTRLTKKIKVIYENKRDIGKLKEHHEYEKGYNIGYEKARKEFENKK